MLNIVKYISSTLIKAQRLRQEVRTQLNVAVLLKPEKCNVVIRDGHGIGSEV